MRRGALQRGVLQRGARHEEHGSHRRREQHANPANRAGTARSVGKNLYTGGAAIAVPLPVLLILSLPMAGQREELYSLKGATLPYRYAHPDTVVVDQQLLH